MILVNKFYFLTNVCTDDRISRDGIHDEETNDGIVTSR